VPSGSLQTLVRDVAVAGRSSVPLTDLVPELGVAVVKYSIKSHPTEFSGVMFRSRLEARWAAFFELVGWSWQYEPIDLNGWSPDFRVEFNCGHSECNGSHSLLVEVKPYYSIEQFTGHHCMLYPYGMSDGAVIPADSSAAFGNDPSVVWWEMSHGAGGGVESDLANWIQDVDIDLAWSHAGNLTQYKPQKKPFKDISQSELVAAIRNTRKRIGLR